MTKTGQRDLFPGALEMMILRILKRKPSHGYALVKHIKRTSHDLLQIEEGCCIRLSSGFSRRSGARRMRASLLQTGAFEFYRLTAAGTKHLEREVSSFERMLEGITRVL